MDAEAARCAYRELEERLRPFIARRVPAADVEDVLQDVFLRAQRTLAEIKDELGFAPWLYRIARSAIAESYRQKGRQPPLIFDDTVEVEAPSDTPSPSPLEEEISAYIVLLVARLPSPYREALTLTELTGLTQRAAADALGVSLSALKSRVQRGREKLRESLEQCCRIALDARGRVVDCTPRQPGTCSCKSD